MRAVLRREPEAVSPVVAEILLVAITVVLAAVIYLMASGILTGHTAQRPIVAFAPGATFQANSHNVSLAFAGVSQAFGPYNFRFSLKVGAVYGDSSVFAASRVAANTTVSGVVYHVTWTDVDGGGTITEGDQILVTGDGVSLPTGQTFLFTLFWDDGTTLATTSWAT
jgi:flagellin-like protein